MDNSRMVSANLEQMVPRESVEGIEWYKKSKEMRWSKKIMIKKHQKRYIYCTQKNEFFH